MMRIFTKLPLQLALLVLASLLLMALPLAWDTLTGQQPTARLASTVTRVPGPAEAGAARPPAMPPEPPGTRRTGAQPPRLGPVKPLGNSEIFVQGLRALLLYLETQKKEHLEQAAGHFDRAVNRVPRQQGRMPAAEFSSTKYAMYRAYCQELLGNLNPKKKLIRSGAVSEGNYQFYFHARLEKLEDVIRMTLQLEDQLYLRHINEALARHAAAHKKRYPARLEALVPKYLEHLPVDPACPKNNYARRYALSPGGGGYTLKPCARLELGGRTRVRVSYDAEEEFKVYHMVVGDFLQPDRLNTFLPPLIKYSGLKAGQVVADIGSGPGLFTFPFARVVGPAGQVIAADVNPSVLAYVRFIAARRPQLKVKVHRCVFEDVGLPANSVDVAFIIQTYHAMLIFSDPGNADIYRRRLYPWLTTIRKALRPDGRLIIQDGLKKISTAILKKQVEGAGFSTVRMETGWDQEIIAVFKK